MRVLNFFSFLFVSVFIAGSYGGIHIFTDMQCVELRAIYYIDSPFDSLKAAMRVCGESFACVGVKKTSGNRFQSLTALTGYVFNETCKDYYLRDKTGGVTFSNQPNQMEAKILFAIYPNGECPSSFFVDGSLCRGRSIVTRDVCYSYPSYMDPQHDGTSCIVLQKQTVINSWS